MGEGESLFSGYAGRMLWVVALGTMASMTGRLVLSPLLPAIIEDLSITPSRAGFALTVMWGFSALMQFPGGRLSDRLSRKTVLVAALGVLIAGYTVLSVTPVYAVFLLGAAVVGVGTGLYPPAAITLLSDLFERKQGKALGIYASSLNFGGVASAGLAVAALAVAVWRAAFLPVLVVLAAVLVLIHRWNGEPYVVERPGLEIRATAGRVLGSPRVRWVIAASALFAFTWQGVASFLPTFLQIEQGYTATFAGNAFAGFFLVATVANPLAGAIGDRLRYTYVAAGASVFAGVGLAGLMAAGDALATLAAVAVLAVGLSSYWPVMNAYVLEGFPGSSKGGDFGALRTTFNVLGSLGPTYVGVVAERATYTLAYTGLVGCLACSTAITLWLARRW